MTDYLTGLAKRTLGLLPVAQPLITPSFSSFTSKMFDRPEKSYTENVAFFDQQVIPGAQEKEAPQDFSKLRSKGQKTAQSWNEFSSGKVEHFVAVNAKNNLLPHKKIGADIRDQRYSEINFITQDTRSIPQPVHIENRVPSKVNGIVTEEKYEEQESVTLSEQTPKYMKNSGHRGNPEGSRIEKEMKDIDIPDPAPISKSLEDPFSEKYGEGDIFSEKHINKKSNLNKKPNLDSSGHKFNLDYPATSDILHDPEKLVSSDPPPGRVARFSEKDRSILKNQENHIIRDIHTKIQQPPIPTIKVTIGRVEVRAVPPQPVFSPSPAMKKPALSLDEYLKQHNG